jgi:isoquinoline 1-oxidoreductase beta subunit
MDLQVTGGSSAVRATGVYGMRVAGAAAREMLVKAAAARWNVSPAECATKSNRVLHAASGKSFGYGELAAEAADLRSPSSTPALKPKSEYTLVGKPIPRVDIPDQGERRDELRHRRAGAGHALRRDQDLAGVRRQAEIGRRRRRRKCAACRRSCKLDDAVVVVADRFWRARDAVAALNPVFDNGANGGVTSATITHARTRR